MRVTYSRELSVKTFLDEKNIENFIPMHYADVVEKGKPVRKLVPVVHNLIFVRTTYEVLEDIKKRYSGTHPLRYIMDREKKRPIIIPEHQMQQFIAVAGTYNQQLIYLPAQNSAMRKGDRVRVTGGIFEGVEGVFVRIKGDRRVVVTIQGVMSVATAFIHPALLECISPKEAVNPKVV